MRNGEAFIISVSGSLHYQIRSDWRFLLRYVPYIIYITEGTHLLVLHFLFVYPKSFNELFFSSLPLFLESGCKGTAFCETCKRLHLLFFRKIAGYYVSSCITTMLRNIFFSPLSGRGLYLHLIIYGNDYKRNTSQPERRHTFAFSPGWTIIEDTLLALRRYLRAPFSPGWTQDQEDLTERYSQRQQIPHLRSGWQ